MVCPFFLRLANNSDTLRSKDVSSAASMVLQAKASTAPACPALLFVPALPLPQAAILIIGTLFAISLSATLLRDENLRVGAFPISKPFHFEMSGFHFEIQGMAPAWGPESLLTHQRGHAFSEEQLGRDS